MQLSLKRIYIAHPLMGDGSPEWGDPAKNVERYLRFVAFACNEGHTVITWVHHYLTHARGLTKGDADFYLTRDRILLRNATELWVCGPPETSAGTRFEIECARQFGLLIITKPEWLDRSFDPLSA